jgi:flagellar biosynthetic protein FlhB
MAENAENRTEAPTPRRRSEARERGQVARSADLSGAVVVTGAVVLLVWLGPRLSATLLRTVAQQLGTTDATAIAGGDLGVELRTLAATIGMAAGPLLAALLALGVVANLIQVGFLASAHPLRLTLDKLNPITGFARLFSIRGLVQLVMNLGKLAVVAGVAWQSVRQRTPEILSAMEFGGWEQFGFAARLSWEFAIRLAAALLALALLDFLWQRYRFERDLRMTREEVKEELRRMEGDPIVRQRRRQMQLRLAIQRLQRDVPKANVVVTNPTELAVAIQYEPKAMAAPKVVAKGRDLIAQRIREIAIEHRIPIVQRKPLAQALFKAVEVGQEIPADFYQAVAEILAYVYQLSKAGRARSFAPAVA